MTCCDCKKHYHDEIVGEDDEEWPFCACMEERPFHTDTLGGVMDDHDEGAQGCPSFDER